MEARIFISSQQQEISNQQKQIASSTLDLSSSKLVDILQKTVSPGIFGSGNPEKLASTFSSASKENRDDLYLVLSPSCGGNFIGIKWRGQTQTLLTSCMSTTKKNKDKEVVETSDNAQQQQQFQAAILEKLLSAPVEIKVSPPCSATSSAAVAASSTPLDALPRPDYVQSWKKFKLNCFGGGGAATSGKPAALFFQECVAKALQKLASGFPQSGMRKVLEFAAGNLLVVSASGKRLFSIVSVRKERKQASCGAFALEQTDMLLNDVTERFFPCNDQKPQQQLFVRSWCAEPHLDREQDEVVARDFCAKILTSPLAVENGNLVKITVASYPQFLAENFCGVSF